MSDQSKKTCVRGKREEGGFALLMVFVLAATIAITLYMEMPRVAFESQRAKEQTLVDRGNQYKRAIQLFYRKNKRFPATIEELESYQNVRYLRRKYKDPFTGKDDWRLIHVGPGGQLTDSLIKKPNPLGAKDKDGKETADSSNPGFTPSESTTPGQPDPNAPTGMNLAVNRRPSDRILTGPPGQGGVLPPGDQDPGQTVPPVYPNQYPNQNTGQQYPPQYPGQPLQPGQLVQPGQAYPQPYPSQVVPGQPGQMLPGQTNPGQPGQPYSYAPGQFNQNLPYANPNNPNAPSSYNPNQPFNPNQVGNAPNMGGQGNPAVNAIQQALFSPRAYNPNQPPNQPPGQPYTNQPPNSVPPPTGGSFGNTAGSSFGQQSAPGMNAGLGTGGAGGIAGVATKYKGPSIKVINDRKKYQELEFVYDLKNDKSLMGNGAGQMGNMQNQQQAPNLGFGISSGSGAGLGGSGSSGGFGGSSGQSSGSGFGSSGSQSGAGSPVQPPRQP